MSGESLGVPCFRCKDENNSVYEEPPEGDKCISCDGRAVVIPGPFDKSDHLMIRKYVHAQWWVRLREMKKLGMKLGKKRDRDNRIRKQARDLFADFKRMGKKEQRTLRLSMSGAIEDFKNLPQSDSGGSCAS